MADTNNDSAGAAVIEPTPLQKQARAAVQHAVITGSGDTDTWADVASDVWAKDYEALAEMLADETIAPRKRIDSALVWIKDMI